MRIRLAAVLYGLSVLCGCGGTAEVERSAAPTPEPTASSPATARAATAGPSPSPSLAGPQNGLTCGEFVDEVGAEERLRYAGFTLLARRDYQVPPTDLVDSFLTNLTGFCVLAEPTTLVDDIATRVLAQNPSYLR